MPGMKATLRHSGEKISLVHITEKKKRHSQAFKEEKGILSFGFESLSLDLTHVQDSFAKTCTVNSSIWSSFNTQSLSLIERFSLVKNRGFLFIFILTKY